MEIVGESGLVCLTRERIEGLLAALPGLRGTGEMLDRLAFGFLALDPAYRVISVNDVGCRLLGVERATIVGHSATVFMTPDVETFRQQRAQRARGMARPYCAATRRADGTLHRVRVVPQLLRGRDGTILGSCGTFTPADAQGRVLDVNVEGRAAYLCALESGQTGRAL